MFLTHLYFDSDGIPEPWITYNQVLRIQLSLEEVGLEKETN